MVSKKTYSIPVLDQKINKVRSNIITIPNSSFGNTNAFSRQLKLKMQYFLMIVLINAIRLHKYEMCNKQIIA